MKTVIALLFFAFGFNSCFATETPFSSNEPVSHEIFDKLLKKHVTGFVDYGGFKKDQSELKKYLTLISANAPAKSWSTNEKLAYWINLYNAYTIQLILDNSDKNLKSIKDIGDKIKIPFVNTPWDVKFIVIGKNKYDLNNIEHGIIRKEFKEPRIHFALVCAAKSCPPLRNEAYVASKLNSQLDDQGVDFLNDKFKNEVGQNSAVVSKLFTWYGGDFKDKMPIIDWINKYSKVKTNKDTNITYKDYNWELNGKL
jgi:hypothetical protein